MGKRAQTPVRTVAPANKLFDLGVAGDAALVEQHIRIPSDVDDAEALQLYLDAAESYLDGWSGVLGRALVTQTWQANYDGFPEADAIALPLAPVNSATVEYIDEAGVTQTFNSSLWHLAERDGTWFVELDEDATWPTTDTRPDAVQITTVCGYGDPDDVPKAIRFAALLLAATWYRDREHSVIGMITAPLSFTVNALISSYRRIGG
jgi:uncharacterized phiE125 gp8 family phage protein